MRRLLLVGFVFLFLFPLSFAQVSGSGPGGSAGSGSSGGSSGFMAVQNDSPTPINGFTDFDAACLLANSVQRLVVCSSQPCENSSGNHLCTSSYSLSNNKTCSSPAPVSWWGANSGIAAACCSKNDSCQPLASGIPWWVGISPSAFVSNASLSSSWDVRSHSVVRRSDLEWAFAVISNNRLRVFWSTNGGVSFPSSFLVASLVPSSSLPSSVVPGNVVADHPSLARSPDGVLHLVFTVRDAMSGKSTVYYSRCPLGANCGSASSWQSSTASLVVDPALDVDSISGSWKYAFAHPKLVVDDQFVHLIFDDAQTESPSRIDGIFYKRCAHSSGCDSFSDFMDVGPSPDLTNGGHAGYPHSPDLRMDSSLGLHVAYLDNGGVFYSRLPPSSLGWDSPSAVVSGTSFDSPSLSVGGDSVLLTARAGVDVRAFSCVSSCVSSSSKPLWVELDEDIFSPLESLSSFSSVVGVLSPSDGERMAFFSSAIVKGIRQGVGLYWDASSSLSSGARTLTNGASDIHFGGLSDVQGLFLSSNPPSSLLDVLMVSNGSAQVLSSNVVDSSNMNPVVSNLSPLSGTWQNSPTATPSTTSFSKSVSFTLQDSDAEDELYVSIFLSPNEGGEDFPLVKWLNVKGSGGQVSNACSVSGGIPFVNPSSCVIPVSLFDPKLGLAVPNGSYRLVVKVQDSSGGLDVVSSSGTFLVSASASQLVVNAPVPNTKWHSKNPSEHVVNFNAQDATFSQSLDLKVVAVSPSGNVVDFGLTDVATYSSTDSSCSYASADYSCAKPLAIPSSIKEGLYSLVLTIQEDGYSTASHTVGNMVLDFSSPSVTGHSPSGSASSFPKTISFSLSDYSGINVSIPMQVLVNGVELNDTPSCTPSSGVVPTTTCVVDFDVDILSLQDNSTPLEVSVSSTDGLGNEGSTSFGFTVGQSAPTGSGNGGSGGGGGGGGGGVSVIPSLDDLVTPTEDGGFGINGTGIVIPGQIVDSFNRFSDRVILTASDLVEVTGPSANAIFLGLCTLAGIASDIVFRRVFAKLAGEMERQRQRVLRMALGLVFFVLPLAVGFQFGLAVGFIFAVLEVVLFIASAYLFKILQYYDTFGFKPIGPAQ